MPLRSFKIVLEIVYVVILQPQLKTPHVMRERPRRVPVFQDTTKEFRFAIEGREVDIPPIKDTLQGGPSGREPALG